MYRNKGKKKRERERERKRKRKKNMIYEQKRFHSADTKYYAVLNQICAYLKFE